MNWERLFQLKQLHLKMYKNVPDLSLIPTIDVKPPGSRMNKIIQATSKPNADIYSKDM